MDGSDGSDRRPVRYVRHVFRHVRAGQRSVVPVSDGSRCWWKYERFGPRARDVVGRRRMTPLCPSLRESVMESFDVSCSTPDTAVIEWGLVDALATAWDRRVETAGPLYIDAGFQDERLAGGGVSRDHEISDKSIFSGLVLPCDMLSTERIDTV